jgi:flavodoxin
MKSCILYYSKTGRTKAVAQSLAEKLSTPTFDILTISPSVVERFDCLIIGTPVNGARPAQETTAFLSQLPSGKGKNAVTFCTYALFKGKTLDQMEQALTEKGYKVVLATSKRGVNPSKRNFEEILNEIEKALST